MAALSRCVAALRVCCLPPRVRLPPPIGRMRSVRNGWTFRLNVKNCSNSDSFQANLIIKRPSYANASACNGRFVSQSDVAVCATSGATAATRRRRAHLLARQLVGVGQARPASLLVVIGQPGIALQRLLDLINLYAIILSISRQRTSGLLK